MHMHYFLLNIQGIRISSDTVHITYLYSVRITYPYSVHIVGSDAELVTLTSICEQKEMAETFSEAMAYALGCIGKVDIMLKEEQSEVVRYVLNGEDTLIWLPTGFGKSVCYKCLPFMLDFWGHMQSADIRKLVIVISPLRSLMVDQVFFL